jgi:hypothetical protein
MQDSRFIDFLEIHIPENFIILEVWEFYIGKAGRGNLDVKLAL